MLDSICCFVERFTCFLCSWKKWISSDRQPCAPGVVKLAHFYNSAILDQYQYCRYIAYFQEKAKWTWIDWKSNTWTQSYIPTVAMKNNTMFSKNSHSCLGHEGHFCAPLPLTLSHDQAVIDHCSLKQEMGKMPLGRGFCVCVWMCSPRAFSSVRHIASQSIKIICKGKCKWSGTSEWITYLQISMTWNFQACYTIGYTTITDVTANIFYGKILTMLVSCVFTEDLYVFIQ